MAHITGGGITGNVNRALPSSVDAVVETGSWDVPNVFQQLERAGGVERVEMFRTFNMGVGMIVLVPEAAVDSTIAAAGAAGVRAWRAGSVRPGTGQVILNSEKSSS